MKKWLFVLSAIFVMSISSCSGSSSSSGGEVSPSPSVPEETFTITWENYDGTILEIDENVSYGVMPTYDGETPTKPHSDTHSFVFAGWSPSVGVVVKDATYRALFNQEELTYIIEFDSNGGSEVESQEVVKGGKITKPIDPTKKGYNFVNWLYQGEVWSFTGNTVSSDMTLVASWSVVTYNITYNLNGGTLPEGVNNPSTYTIEDNVLLNAPTKQGHTFAGWVLGGQIITYIPEGTTGNLYIEATWASDSYSVMVNFDASKGEVIGSGTYKYGDIVTLTAAPKNGYRFAGWYQNGYEKSKTSPYSFIMGDENVILEARFDLEVYSISYELNGGVNNQNNPSEYTVDDEFDFLAPTKENYIFQGWTLNGQPITGIKKGTTGNIIVYATWNVTMTNVTVNSSDETKGTVSGGGTFEAGSQVTIIATPSSGYAFDGWYDSKDSLVSEQATYTFTLGEVDLVFTAQFSEREYKITYDLNGGTQSCLDMPAVPETYNTNEETYLPGHDEYWPDHDAKGWYYKEGHTFVGWLCDGEIITSIAKGSTGDKHLVAQFNKSVYNVNVACDEHITVSGAGSYEYGSQVNLSVTNEDNGWRFKDYYNLNNESVMSIDKDYSFTMWELTDGTDLNIKARSELIQYSITLNLNGGSLSASTIPSFYTINSEDIDLTTADNTPIREGYDFDGWYLDNTTKIDCISGSMARDIEIVCHWTTHKYDVKVQLEQTGSRRQGTVSGSGSYDYQGNVTVVANPNLDAEFIGWYENNVRVSSEASYTFTMPNRSVNLVAKIYSADGIENIGAKPRFLDEEKKTLEYGMYPQTLETDVGTIGILNTRREQDDPYYKFHDWYIVNEIYYIYKENSDQNKCWYRCDPIQWQVMESDGNGHYIIQSTKILDNQTFYSKTGNRTWEEGTIYPNNYVYSDIYKWLDSSIVGKAFGVTFNHLENTLVDNSAATTNSPDNPYACNNVENSVFLFSYQDYLNPEHGYGTTTAEDSTRQCKASDYAVINGVKVDSDQNGFYWTRSPSSSSSTYVWMVNQEGKIVNNSCNYTGIGVRPVMHIYIDPQIA